MPLDNRCEPWRLLGLPCPFSLLDAVDKRRKREKVPVEVPDDELVKEERAFAEEGSKRRREIPPIVVFDRLQREGEMTTVSMQDWEAVLLEIARRSASQTIDMPVGVPVPQEIVDEAVRQGARGPSLGLWVAAVAAVLAAIAAGGVKAGLAVPGALRGVASLPGTVRPGGMHFNAAQALEFALQSVGKSDGTGQDGEYFPGILG